MIAKTGGAKFQWEIMRSLGLKDDEIKEYDELCLCNFIVKNVDKKFFIITDLLMLNTG